jgi:hypothetical protein
MPRLNPTACSEQQSSICLCMLAGLPDDLQEPGWSDAVHDPPTAHLDSLAGVQGRTGGSSSGATFRYHTGMQHLLTVLLQPCC